MAEQLALMKLAGWRLEYDEELARWEVVWDTQADYNGFVADTNREQAIRRAFGYFRAKIR